MDDEERAAVIDFLGMVVFATIVGIGLLDGRSGLSVFAVYRSPTVAGVGRWLPMTERRAGGDQPKPPAPAQ
jgi:hypothetical protein